VICIHTIIHLYTAILKSAADTPPKRAQRPYVRHDPSKVANTACRQTELQETSRRARDSSNRLCARNRSLVRERAANQGTRLLRQPQCPAARYPKGSERIAKLCEPVVLCRSRRPRDGTIGYISGRRGSCCTRSGRSPQETFGAEVLVELGPVNDVATTSDLPLQALRTARVKKPRKPNEWNHDRATVG
jgi:hypothetical protein